MKLELNGAVWMLFGVSTLLWLASLILAGSRRERSTLGWRVIPLSLFGFAWAGFCADFVLRFLALVYDPELFRASQYPMWRLPAGQLTRTWLCLGGFWCIFCAGVVIALRLGRGKMPRLLAKLNHLEDRVNLKALDVLAACSTAVVHPREGRT